MGGRCGAVRAVHRITNANGDGDRDRYSYCNCYADADGDTYTAEACSNTKASSHAAASPVVRLIAGGLMI